MANFSDFKTWVPETSGERLFFLLQEFVYYSIPDLNISRDWIVSPEGYTSLCRTIASMELTHRCLNTSVNLLEMHPEASVQAVMHRLRMVVRLSPAAELMLKIAQAVRLAALDYINRKLTPARVDEIHANGPKTCCWCGRQTYRRKPTPTSPKATVEHLWPEFLGGSSSPDNLTIACQECNTARQHGFTWAWFSIQAVNEKLDTNGKLPRNLMLSLAIHRLMKVASGQTPLSLSKTTLKQASLQLGHAIPEVTLERGTRYTYFEILQNASE